MLDGYFVGRVDDAPAWLASALAAALEGSGPVT